MLSLELAVATGLLLLVWAVNYLRASRYFWRDLGVPDFRDDFGPLFRYITFADFRGKGLQRWYRYARRHGHQYLGVNTGVRQSLVPVHPDVIKKILVKDFAHFMDHGVFVDKKGDPLQANLFNLMGSEWKAVRSKLTPTFTSGKMRAMFPLVKECAAQLDQLLRNETAKSDDNVLGMHEIMARFTTDVIGTCAFGVQANSLSDPDGEFRTMGRAAFEVSPWHALFLVLVWRRMPAWLRHRVPIAFTPRKVQRFFVDMFNKNVAFRESNKIVRNDFLDLLIGLKGQEGGIDESILPAQAFVFFLAGFETSSNTMGTCITELSEHPEVQARVREEVDAVLARHGGELSYEALKEMTYMEQVIEETLRLYPALISLPRVVTQEYRLPGSKAVLPKKTSVLIPVYAIHRDPEYYPDPDTFNPDNFSEEAKRSRPQYTYMPFGDGPRLCIGLRFAMMQMKTALATILRSYEIQPCEEGRKFYPIVINPRSFVTQALGGSLVHLAPRPRAKA